MASPFHRFSAPQIDASCAIVTQKRDRTTHATAFSVAMRLTVAVPSIDGVVSITIDGSATIADLKAAVGAELDRDVRALIATVDGRTLETASTASSSGSDSSLARCGFKDNDLVALVAPGGGRAATTTATNGSGNSIMGGARATSSDGSAVDPLAMMRAFATDRVAMERLRVSDPVFARAIESGDVETFQTRMREFRSREAEAMRIRNDELALLHSDPFDIEAQRKIEEAIRKANVEENMRTAIDETPEVFGQVVMLYVDAEINGVALKAFVDSGAQMSIMSVTCARRCGLERLIDDRFQGTAKGVGTQKILGRIHQAPMKVGGTFLSTAITVLEKEQDIDFIFGLDMLRRHQCTIDLRKNVLAIGSADVELPFLGESEIPRGFDGAASPPTAPAPSRSVDDDLPRSVNEDKVSRLISLGFTRAQALEALEVTGGDVDLAGAMLFG